MSETSLANRMVNGVFWLAVTKALGQAMSWVITLVVVRLLAPQDYGLMGLALLFTRFMLLFNELGLGAAIVQKRELTNRQLSDVTWVIFLVNLALSVVLFVLAPFVARYFNEPALAGIVRAMGAVFVINGIGASSGFVLQRDMAFRKKAGAEVIGNAAGGLVTLGSAVAGAGVWSLVFGYLVTQATTNAMYCVYAPIPLERRFSLRNVQHFLHFGSQVALGKVLWWTSSSADSVIVGRVLGTVQLGYYGLAVQFSAIPLDRIVSLISQVALPSFAAVQHDAQTLRRHYLKMVGAIALITFPIFVGMALMADSGVRLILTEKWAPIVAPLQFLCLASCLRAIETMNTPALLARNRPGIPLFNSLLQAVALPLAFVVGTRWGVQGVALAWLVTWPLLFAIVTMQTLRVIGLPLASYLESVRHPLAGSIAMAAVVASVRQLAPAAGPSLPGFALMCAAGAISYLAYHAAFNRQTLREVAGILKLRKAPRSTPMDVATDVATGKVSG